MSVRLRAGCRQTDVTVIGGGLVGLTIALGLIRNGLKVTILDEGDVALRASRGNFGLVWVQGKGDTCPEYAQLSRLSARLWGEFSQQLQSSTGIDIQLDQRGGLFICLEDAELEQRQRMLCSMREQAAGNYPFEVLDHAQLRALVPEIGPRVAGATLSLEDGHLNPLLLLRALVEDFVAQGGQLISNASIGEISMQGGEFSVLAGHESWYSEKLVLAAGLGNQTLASQVGLSAPLKPNRGQVLITERVQPFLHYPTGHVRQTGDGTLQLGDSKEDVGFDSGTTTEVMAKIAQRATRMFPLLEQVRMVRAWGALRVMTPDGYPIYEESSACPGAFLVTCHSGVTLGAAHAGPIADWIAGKPQAFSLEVFRAARFDV
ncbi:FAD-binding oxidoreductase [Pseudomonas sp.]|uniref:NAD(P)/FAD-dependent oxidoreductase n=1 Tax=Pseudomonas sp. TaxID=306 RepID=UPI0027321D4B|nr:FAD-dependent oxidoreductase [Pseudomonas sp.]MDP2243386.1 FAD-dependent oxidoreductase [Pseudomonas sp.]